MPLLDKTRFIFIDINITYSQYMFLQDAINTVLKFCGARFFSLQLPGYSLLMLDFLHAANTIVSNNDLKGVTIYYTIPCLSTNIEIFF